MKKIISLGMLSILMLTAFSSALIFDEFPSIEHNTDYIRATIFNYSLNNQQSAIGSLMWKMLGIITYQNAQIEHLIKKADYYKRSSRSSGGGCSSTIVYVPVKNNPDPEEPEEPILNADLNGDGSVNEFDLSRVLCNWESNDEEGDINGDGLVDGADLGVVLANWDESLIENYNDLDMGSKCNDDILMIYASWGQSGDDIMFPEADMNGDGIVDGTDLGMVLARI